MATHSYTHDSMNNRIVYDGGEIAINDLNQVLTANGKTYAYDLAGNLILDNESSYLYDALDRLITVVKKEEKYRYIYDSQNRRIAKQKYCKTTSGWSLETTTKFLYQGSCEVGSLEGDAFTSFRALGAGLGAEIGAAFALEIEGVVYAPTHDQSGSVVALVDAQTGDLVHAARYSAFGQVEKSHGLSPPYQFSSKRLDPETGWIYFGRRYYDSSLGRWTTCDPTGYSDGFNLYAYVHNNPLTHFDEYGLFDGYWDPTPEEIGMYDPRAQFQGMKNAAVYPFTCACDFNFKSLINNSIDVLSNPRVQGSLQAFIGAAEASAGGSAIFCSGGLAAPVGWPVFAHGLDQFVAGMNTAITGRETATITEHLLQTAGMSPQSASITNDLLSVVGTVGASSIIQGSRFQACSRFQLPNEFSSFTNFGKQNKVLRKRFSPDEFADGGHSVFRKNPITGKTEKYQTYWPQSNPRNPNPWELGVRFDGSSHYHKHFNKVTDKWIETPHVHDPFFPGGVRYPQRWEVRWSITCNAQFLN